MGHPRVAPPLVAAGILLGSACSLPPAEEYGFVTRLGRDTIAVEAVTRRGDIVTIDAVDRFPRVRRRHAEVTLRADGTIERLVMDIHSPSEASPMRDRHVVATVSDSVRVVLSDSTGIVRRTFARRGAAMAHVPQMYSLYELYVAAALRRGKSTGRANGDTVMMRQFYLDREFDDFPLHHGVVRILDATHARISHDWLSGSGEATVDPAFRLLAYDGSGSTYDVRVARVASRPDVASFDARFTAEEAAAGGARRLSVRDTVRGAIGGASITIDYGRPLARGRVLVGGLIPYDRVWRTGANEATGFTTTAPLTLAGLTLPAGSYTLWTLPHRDGVELIVNRQTGQWGTRYDASRDLGRARMTVSRETSPVEQFTIDITPDGAGRGEMVMRWGDVGWSAPITSITAITPRR